jgi:putative acyl-CoA dehydrogenase
VTLDASTPTRANQPPPLEGYDLYGQNRPLVEAVAREGAGWADPELRAFGAMLGGELLELGRLANEHPPKLRTHDRFGERIDEVEFHPAWHELLRLGVEHGVHASPWREPRPGAHVARAAAFSTLAQVEAGVGCPLSMTFAAVPVLRAEPDLAAEWLPLLTSTVYDPGLRPAAEKAGATCGMAITERQGGSDVRANEMRAQPLGDGEASLRGEKWFCSAPMSDAFLVLAHARGAGSVGGKAARPKNRGAFGAPGGLTCYLVPRVLPDGTRNAFRIMRLKDKLGNRSNASAEIELADAWARPVGEEGRGIATIMEMVVHTRLDCVLGSLGLMRRAVAEATHHAAHRRAFGRRLIEQPLMTNVLADLCVDAEAATVLALRLARAYDEDAVAFRRLATSVAKYWVCKATPPLVAEALECIGGNGYVEESVLPRLFRESPLNSIWEGAGNVQALDVLRAVERQPESLEAVLAEVDAAVGADARFDAAVSLLRAELAEAADGANGRRLVERLALCLSGALLLRADSPVAEAFCATRLAGEGGRAYGTLPRGLDAAAVVERHLPQLPR